MLKLLKNWRIHNIFHLLLLKQDITKKKRMDKNVTELDAGDNSKEYKVEIIWDSAVYAKKSKNHLSKLYYLVAWKNYFKEENT